MSRAQNTPLEHLYSSDYDSVLAHVAASSIRGRIGTGPRAGALLERLFVHAEPAHSPSPSERSAHMDGFSLHAGVSIEANRRGKLEHLCRYIARPPISTDRLTLDERGRILYRLRHPYRDGTTHIVFTPTSFLERLKHLLTYHGVLAPASSWRPEIIPRGAFESVPASTSRPTTRASLERQQEQVADLRSWSIAVALVPPLELLLELVEHSAQSIGVPKGCFEPGSSSRGLPDVGSGGRRGPEYL